MIKLQYLGFEQGDHISKTLDAIITRTLSRCVSLATEVKKKATRENGFSLVPDRRLRGPG
ncbi:MAG: hypothetical protein AB9919_11570 [Geobacteraceae bacterium]